ncbi:hypothetical protein, partial [Klebsiella pneumoniae]|uniref:hypothetical protein n=1 Tax=Klebsiella pneumoniae TaxID=573 RepID=UPI0039691412
SEASYKISSMQGSVAGGQKSGGFRDIISLKLCQWYNFNNYTADFIRSFNLKLNFDLRFF